MSYVRLRKTGGLQAEKFRGPTHRQVVLLGREGQVGEGSREFKRGVGIDGPSFSVLPRLSLAMEFRPMWLNLHHLGDSAGEEL